MAASIALPDARRPVLLIGRLDDCDVVLTEPTISRHHAALMLFGGRWFVIDRGSTNGTWVNDRQIWGVSAVRPGDRLRLGSARFRLRPPYSRLIGHVRVLAGTVGAAV